MGPVLAVVSVYLLVHHPTLTVRPSRFTLRDSSYLLLATAAAAYNLDRHGTFLWGSNSRGPALALVGAMLGFSSWGLARRFHPPRVHDAGVSMDAVSGGVVACRMRLGTTNGIGVTLLDDTRPLRRAGRVAAGACSILRVYGWTALALLPPAATFLYAQPAVWILMGAAWPVLEFRWFNAPSDAACEQAASDGRSGT